MIVLQEGPTTLTLTGSEVDLGILRDHYTYKCEGAWHSDLYQMYRRHQAAIKSARKSGNISLAQSLESRKVGWDGTKCVLRLRRRGQDMVGSLARGHLKGLLEDASLLGVEIDSKGRLKNPFEDFTLDDIPDDLLSVDPKKWDQAQWEIQKPCVLAWLLNGIARNKVTVSGGKTPMFCAAAAMVKRRFPGARILYLTPTERLVKQVFVEAGKFLPAWNITQFGGAVKDPTGKDLVVCTVAVLRARYNELVSKGWFKTFICVLVDECHGSLSPSGQKILAALPSYFRFSASDTAREDDTERNLLLTGLCGPIFERIDAIDLIKMDRIATPTIEIVKCPAWEDRFISLGQVPETGSKAWVLSDEMWLGGTYQGHVYELDINGDYREDRRGDKIPVPGLHLVQIDGVNVEVESRWCLLERRYDCSIITFKERNNLIAERAVQYSSKGWATLVIATRTLHVKILESLIQQKTDPNLVRVLFSAHSSEERDETFEWLKSTPGAILISPLVKMGVSINQLRGGIIADFVADHELLNQMVGRFVRKKPDGTENESTITIFEDNQHPSMARTFRTLIDKMKQIEGYKWQETIIDQ